MKKLLFLSIAALTIFLGSCTKSESKRGCYTCERLDSVSKTATYCNTDSFYYYKSFGNLKNCYWEMK